MKKILIILLNLILQLHAVKRLFLPGENEKIKESEELSGASKVFMSTCAHPGGKEEDSVLQFTKLGFVILFQVRNGLGVMSSFS